MCLQLDLWIEFHHIIIAHSLFKINVIWGMKLWQLLSKWDICVNSIRVHLILNIWILIWISSQWLLVHKLIRKKLVKHAFNLSDLSLKQRWLRFIFVDLLQPINCFLDFQNLVDNHIVLQDIRLRRSRCLKETCHLFHNFQQVIVDYLWVFNGILLI